MQRVLVIGISGAGKSTFSRALAAQTGLPLIHLDKEFWQPGWVIPKRETWRPKVAQLAAGAAWVMDGNYGSSLPSRLPLADAVVWFDYPRLKCLRRAFWRSATTWGRVRADMAPGCPEQFDSDFVRYIWRFNDIQRPEIVQALKEHAPHLIPVIFRHDGDAAAFLSSLPEHKSKQAN